MRNCPNCGAPIEPYKCKCEYCGTWYFDFTSWDMTENVPYYVKFKTSMGVITALAKPEIQTIDLTYDTVDAMSLTGTKLYTITTNRNCDLNVSFHCQASPKNNYLFTLQK